MFGLEERSVLGERVEIGLDGDVPFFVVLDLESEGKLASVALSAEASSFDVSPIPVPAVDRGARGGSR